MNARRPLKIIGLEDCWENVHPDVVHLPQRFAGYPYWMVFTPFPLMNDRFENPTLRASHDGWHWQRVPGISDPLVPSPADPQMHHADPELIYHQGRLHVVYLTIRRWTNETTFSEISCGDDLHWSEPRVIGKSVNAVSPTFQVQGDVLHEWFVHNHELVHCDGPDLSSLGHERKCRVSIPDHVPWHVDILKVENGYEALIAAFPRGTDMSRTRLFHLSSEDGLAFRLSRDSPLIGPSTFGWDNRMIYRSSFLKEPDGTYRIWYSAASWGRHLGIGLLQGSLDSLRETVIDLAPVPPYLARLPGDLAGWLRYENRHLLLAPLLSFLRTRFFRDRQR
jgi:hypothetical protein